MKRTITLTVAFAATILAISTIAAPPASASGTKSSCAYFNKHTSLKEFGSKYHDFCSARFEKRFKAACKAAGRKSKTNSSGKIRCLKKNS